MLGGRLPGLEIPGLGEPREVFLFFARSWMVPKRTHMHIHIHMHMHRHNIHVHMPYIGPDGTNMMQKMTKYEQKCNFLKLSMSQKSRNVNLSEKKAPAGGFLT